VSKWERVVALQGFKTKYQNPWALIIVANKISFTKIIKLKFSSKNLSSVIKNLEAAKDVLNYGTVVFMCMLMYFCLYFQNN